MAITQTVITPHTPANFSAAVDASGRYLISVGTSTFTVFDNNTSLIRAYNWTPPPGVTPVVHPNSYSIPLWGGVGRVFGGSSGGACLVVCYPDGTFDAFSVGLGSMTSIAGVCPYDTGFALALDHNGYLYESVYIAFYDGTVTNTATITALNDHTISGLTAVGDYLYAGSNNGIKVYRRSTLSFIGDVAVGGSCFGRPLLDGTTSYWPTGVLRKVSLATPGTPSLVAAGGGSGYSSSLALGADGRVYWSTATALHSWKAGTPNRSDAITYPATPARTETHAMGSELRIAFR